jgi:hypothetical protein
MFWAAGMVSGGAFFAAPQGDRNVKFGGCHRCDGRVDAILRR